MRSRRPECPVLLVTSAGPIGPYALDLGRAGARVVTATSDGALDAIRREPALCIVAIDQALGNRIASALLSSIRSLEPHLPVVWIREPSTGRPSFAGSMPDLVLASPIDPAETWASIARLVRDDAYSPGVVDALCEGATSVLDGAFQTPAGIGAVFYKANRSPLAQMSSLLQFTGPRVSGWLLVSAASSIFGGVLARLFPGGGRRTGTESLQDVAGELANHLVGRLKARFSASGFGFEFSMPYLNDSDPRMRSVRGRPSVVVRAEVADKGVLFVQLHLDAKEPVVIGSGSPRGEVADGEIRFL